MVDGENRDILRQQIKQAPPWAERLLIEYLISPEEFSSQEARGMDVVQGLSQTPKTLPAKYFYDDRGSQLFEQICELPEYYLTRTETAILQETAAAIAHLTGACELVELGSGSSTKTRFLLDAYQSLAQPFCYRPIDISAGILEQSAQSLLQDYPSLKVHGLVGTYELGLQHLFPAYLSRRMICFLGSTLGNLSPEECDRFFDQIGAALQPDDFFLLGVDLHKSTAQLEAAYNDRQGVTAEFNLNLLRHLNHRFGSNFDLTQFEHEAFYNQPLRQIEMHLRSLKPQTVYFSSLNLTIEFQAEETIRSEISRKFDLSSLQAQLQQKGLPTVQIWTDADQAFGLLLVQRCHEVARL